MLIVWKDRPPTGLGIVHEIFQNKVLCETMWIYFCTAHIRLVKTLRKLGKIDRIII